MQMTFLMILTHSIPLMMLLMIFLMTICLTILLHGKSQRVAMMLLTVWLGWKLKSNAGAAQRKNASALLARQR
jgi:hypothetical protein